ncbi:MAG: 4-hydroxythreonine-4-phosphate dehydrogenase 2 [Candidatus Omnitrophica bacterium ADurb.Bin277]|nr:MAG: 4-hydroxythreonine-4-phosphate dehydrogenase 2 [Candidatus Omnitrophica bacterium ADurb.Bin277]
MGKFRILRHSQSSRRPPVIAITMGDPGGIGPEVIVKALRRHKLRSSCRYIVIGSRKIFSFLKQKTRLSFPFESLSPGREKLRGGKVYFWEMGDAPFDAGKEAKVNGRAAIRAIEAAAELARRGLVQAIVTAPLNKASARLVRKDFIGHTEFFAEHSGAKRHAMMFVGPKLKLTLATIHAPLKTVSSLLSPKSILDKIELTAEMLRGGFGIRRPKIAVCALNPHGRECGKEEDRIILPSVKRARKKGINVSGPYPADQVFYSAYHGKFDALIAMYHDQGLGPFKMVHFHDGVNVTLGLPYIRTSPDHGTAYDIAYKGKADSSSMTAALKLSETLVLNRVHPA